MTNADACELMIRILEDAPTGGLSMHEIQDRVHRDGLGWTLTMVNEVLCQIRPHIQYQKVRRKTGKVTLYQLRSKAQNDHE